MKTKAQRLRAEKIRRGLQELRSGGWDNFNENLRNFSEMPYPPYKQIASILRTAQDPRVRETVVYFLSFVHQKPQGFTDANGVSTSFKYLRPHHPRLKRDYEPLKALLRVFHDRNEHFAVRAQALEGFALQFTPKKYPLRSKVERAVLLGLNDESTEVRFWACYAACNSGEYRVGVKSALSKLQEIVANDKTLCPHWWYVAEEARDAVLSIQGFQNKFRTPVQQRKNKTLIPLYFELSRSRRAIRRRKTRFSLQVKTIFSKLFDDLKV